MASFFNRLGKTISDTTNSVVKKTKSSTNTMRLNGQINEEERNINNAYLAIGKEYVNLHRDDNEPVFSEQCQKIAESRQKIFEDQEQIRKNKHILLCENCGAEMRETILFCTVCGAENPVGKRLKEERDAAEAVAQAQAAARAAAQAQAAAEQAQAAVNTAASTVSTTATEVKDVCPNCGATKAGDAKFCTTCGYRYEKSDAVSTEAETPVDTETTNAAAATEPKTCKSCGAEIPEGNKFCVKCGEKVAD
ncbi:MAG: zinc ribbon domain-containing protein [Ruminococcus sp.]|nr:zinc ribbon domain-containing protein [Ruminococcus sp.]